MIHRPQRNWGCRIHETDLYGMAAVVMENDLVRLTILAGKGADLVEFNYKRRDMDFAWLAPAGIRNPVALHSTSPDLLATFIDVYPGGWQEIFPNAGEASVWAGAQYGQHGEVSALPWDVQILTDTENEITVRFSVRGVKTPCYLEREVTLVQGEPGLTYRERLTNLAPVSFDAMWGHHITFGGPFLVPGAKLTVPDGVEAIPHDFAGATPVRRVGTNDRFDWPVGIDPDGQALDFSTVPEPGTANDLFYLTGFGDEAWYEIERPDEALGMRVTWDGSRMPYLWYWQEFGTDPGYPWHGRTYNIGLEPSSSYPTTGLPDAMANGSGMTIAPGETITMWLKATVLGCE